MDTVTERQKEILAIIINGYVETVCPVGSKTIAEKFDSEISSATIRNDMVDLERIGFVTHPHTSAGRVPTDRGYRFFVNSILRIKSVDSAEAGLIAHEYRQKVRSIEELIERTTRILSFLTEQAGLVLYPSQKALVLKRIELIPYGHAHLLVVWAMATGIVQNTIVDMEELIPNEELDRLNRFLNAELCGKCFSEIHDFLQEKLPHVQQSLRLGYRLATEIAERVFQCDKERKFYLDGSRYVLKQPEFQEDALKARTFFRALETRETLRLAFDQNLAQGEVRVQIGTENQQKDMWDCSLVTTQYYFQNRALGALGILGPKRMPYARVISLVDCIARRFSDALENLV